MPPAILEFLPTLNAILNATSGVLLLIAYRHIKQGRPAEHKKFMLSAIGISILFLTSYLTFHAFAGSVRYPINDWTRSLYLAILIPHSIFAALMVPFIIMAVIFGLKGKFSQHTAITRWLWPVWMFVSASGVVVYLMLYQYAGARPTF